MEPFFSVIVVCLNPGEKLRATLESIKKQSFQDYEVVIKDGFSRDGSLACVEQIFPGCEALQEKERVALEKSVQREKQTGLSVLADEEKEGRDRADKRLAVYLVQEKDTGIYDAMNQAATKAKGKYVYYLNCGDLFYSETVLQEMADFIKEKTAGNQQKKGIYYGNIFERLTQQQVASNPQMNAFGCYRNVPCHQACFYSRELLLAHPFETRYKVRADYEQFLWCFFTKEMEGGVEFAYQDMLVADYEGGGFSETKENRKVSATEHKEITEKYMGKGQCLKYRMILLCTLAPLRTFLAENEKTAGFYNKLKEMLYAKKG